MPSMTLDEVVAEVSRLPAKWHGAGSLAPAVLDAIARHGSARPIQHSVETGTGKSTLVLSHCSADHTVFAQDDAGQGDSLVRVQGSPMLRRETVTFVVGATQRTLPRHQFDHPLDLVLVDGPHGYPFPEIEYYFLYPHLAPGGILIVDDIHIPTVFNLFSVLREDAMFQLTEVIETTAFFTRTPAPLFDPFGDNWWLQTYNDRRFPIADPAIKSTYATRLKRLVPTPLKKLAKRVIATGSR